MRAKPSKTYSMYIYRIPKEEILTRMVFEVGQVIKMKKAHPCGTNSWEILRVGMDFRLRCTGCDHQVMVPRKLVEKNFKGFIEE